MVCFLLGAYTKVNIIMLNDPLLKNVSEFYIAMQKHVSKTRFELSVERSYPISVGIGFIFSICDIAIENYGLLRTLVQNAT